MKEKKITTKLKNIVIGIFYLLIIFVTLESSLAVETNIDIGSPAIDRTSSSGVGTFIIGDNPANSNGTITSIEFYAYSSMTNVEVATFYVQEGNIFSTRDSAIIGTVVSGSKQTFNDLNLTVQQGDYLGFYIGTGSIEVSLYGTTYWSKVGDYIPCNSITFTPATDRLLSVYGMGITFEQEEEPVVIVPLEVDYNNTANVIFLFVMVFAYLGVMTLGFMFNNFGFASLGFFIGVIIGFMLSSFSMFLTFAFLFLDIIIFYGFSKSRKR